jgi:hypothetical protein
MVSFQSEIHYQVQEQVLKHKLSLKAEKIMQLNPKFILGELNLFEYDSENQIVLNSSFQNLLKLLVLIEELDPKALTANSLEDLNSIIQQPQGFRGGLLRKEEMERWHLKDNPNLQKHRDIFDVLLQPLGFVIPKAIEERMTVDHCIIFGADTETMETRIIETLNYLKNNLTVTGHIFLLGSNRKLNQDEKEHLNFKLEKLEENERNYWNDSEFCTEANAFTFLWKCLVPKEMQALLEDRCMLINSTRVGQSYSGQRGQRATTETTIEDWMVFYRTDEVQSIFAITELPYLRLADHLRATVLSKGKQAHLEELKERIKNTTFYFAIPEPNSSPLLSVILDEIARNVYRTIDTIKYLEETANTP